LEAWATARAANLPFYRDLTPEQLARTGHHPHHGPCDLVIELAYHDQDHLQQIAAIIQAALCPDMDRFTAVYARTT
jgi:hypothetical protein